MRKSGYRGALATSVMLVGILMGTWYWRAHFGPPRRDVRMCVVQLPSSALPAIAEELSYFEAEHLHVDMRVESLGKTCLEHLLNQRTDFAVAYITPTVRALEKDGDLRIISEIHSSTHATSIVYRKDRGIERPEDLEGKRVALIPGTHAEMLLRLFALAHGMDEAKIVKVPADPSTIGGMVQSGRADAVVSWSAVLSNLLESQPETFGSMESSFYTEFSMIVGRKDQIAGVGPALLRALRRAQAYYEDHPKDAQKIAGRKLGLDSRFNTPAVWDTYRVKLGLSNVLKSIALEEYLFAVGVRYGAINLAENRVRSYFDERPLSVVDSDAVWFR